MHERSCIKLAIDIYWHDRALEYKYLLSVAVFQ